MTHAPSALLPFRPRADERAWLRRRLVAGDPAMLIGPTGCGKTTLVHGLAAELGRPLVEMIGTPQLALGDLVGRWHLDAGDSIFRDGPLTRAVRTGAIFYLDEIEGVGEDVTLGLASLLDDRRALHIPALGEVVPAHPDFTFVASFNPRYSRVREPLSPAFRQRFRFLAMTWLTEDAEADLVSDATGLDRDRALLLAQAAGLTRTLQSSAVPEGASTRLVLQAARDLVAGEPLEAVAEACLILPLSDEPETLSQLRDTIGMHIQLGHHHLVAPGRHPRWQHDDADLDEEIE